MKRLLCLLLLLSLALLGCQPGGAPTTAPATTTPTEPAPELNVHFIDVGQADSILLECEGEFMLIDGGNVADSSLVVTYLQQQGVEELEYVFCTHAHEDHVGGLPGVLAVYPTGAVYAPTKTYSSNCFDDFVYYTDQQGLEIVLPQPGDTWKLGAAQVTLLGPVRSYAETNDTSLVLLVQLGQVRFLFTGDMETAAENDMLDYWGEEFDIHADVLKVGHHGSETSTGYRLLYEVAPKYGVISVGKDNSYNHPNEQPLSRLNDAQVTLYRTDEMGHILANTNGTELQFTWKSASAQPVVPDGKPTEPTQAPSEPHPGVTYIGNKNSLIFHLPTCSSLPGEANRVELESYAQAVVQGYTPCGRCLK